MLNIAREEPIDHALTALAHPTRRQLLRLLVRGDARVTDLAGAFDVSLNAISRHVQVLERGGLVRRRVHGREHILSLNPSALDAAAAWIDEQRAAWSARLRAMDEALQRRDGPKQSRQTRKEQHR